MDRDNKREITISIPEPIYEELQNAAKQLSGWEREQLQGTEPVSYTHLDVYKRQPMGKIEKLTLPI